MYGSERELAVAKYFPDGFDEIVAAEVFGEHLLGAATDNLRELTHEERERIFNLGYYTWVEQQGTSLEEFQVRRKPSFWEQTRAQSVVWDELIDELNARTGVVDGL
jgi:cysteine synthase A